MTPEERAKACLIYSSDYSRGLAIAAHIREVVLEEREACAALVEKEVREYPIHGVTPEGEAEAVVVLGGVAADAIRARPKP